MSVIPNSVVIRSSPASTHSHWRVQELGLGGDIAISLAREAVVVTNLLIRGLSEAAGKRIDAEAAALG